MQDLRILFAAAEDTGYRAELADAEGRRLGAEVPFSPFLTEEDYEDLRWYLEEYMELPDGGAVIRAQRIEGEIEALAQLDGLPAPFSDFAVFLRQIAAGQVAPIPDGLPGELRGWLEELVQAIRHTQD
jgi:hypothetical protein